MAKIIVCLEVSNLLMDTVMEEIATTLVDHLGAAIISLRVTTEFETIVIE